MSNLEDAFLEQFGDEPMTALVVGGSGGIGGHLIQLLLRFPGVHVCATSRAGAQDVEAESEKRRRGMDTGDGARRARMTTEYQLEWGIGREPCRTRGHLSVYSFAEPRPAGRR